MESLEGVGESPSNKCLGDKPHGKISEDDHKHSLRYLLEDVSDFKTNFLLNYSNCGQRKLSRNRYEFVGMKRSASVAVMNSACESGSLEVDEHKFFVRLINSSKELRSKIWEKREAKKKKEMDEELMKCKKDRAAAIRTASEAVEAVQAELAKTVSLTLLRGRLQEAETNNQELKESIYHKMSDRSLLRVSSQPDMARLVWQIISVKSQVTVLQERLQNLSEKFQNFSPIPSPSKQDSSMSFRERKSVSSLNLGQNSKSSKLKARSGGWRTMMSRIFGVKKDKD